MVKTRSTVALVVFSAGAAVLLLIIPVQAASCAAVVGKWAWFVGGEVTIKPDGTFTQQSGNSGTWECTNAVKGVVTLRWRYGGFVNRMLLSSDAQGLSSTDPSQPLVTAKRIGAVLPKKGDQQASTVPNVVLSTQPDGVRQLPKDLPELMQAATLHAQAWRHDAIPVTLEFHHRDAPNPTMRGPEVRFSFLSTSDGTGLFVTVTAAGASTFEVNRTVRWGTVSLPPVFVDLPAAVRIAREHGMKGSVNRASLRIWSPSGAPAILAWMVGDKTINGASGEIIDYDVTGYIASYNKQWEQAARGLRALMRSTRGGASSWSGGDFSFPPTGSSSDAPYDDGSKAREAYERNAAESRAYWGGSAEDYNRIKNGECTMSDSSRFGC